MILKNPIKQTWYCICFCFFVFFKEKKYGFH